jgi:hypothetical protein
MSLHIERRLANFARRRARERPAGTCEQAFEIPALWLAPNREARGDHGGP